MRLLPAQEALDFAASVSELLASACDAEALRTAWDSPDGRVPGLWKRLADLGVTGLTVPEAHGGSGMDLTFLVEMGRAAAPEPLVESLAGAELLSRAGGAGRAAADEWLPRVVAGDAVVALGEGSPALLAGARWADLFLVAGDNGVRVARREAVDVTPAASLDPGVGLGSVAMPTDGDVLDAAAGTAAFDFACVAVAAELVGLAQAMLDMAVRYAQQREQFGKPIGTFQAVKHQLADSYVANAFVLPVVHRAAWSVARDLPSRARDASHAKHAASAAAERAARTALQVHAGIGYTYEHDLHMWMKRTWSLSALWGDAAFHRRRVAGQLLIEDAPPRIP